MPRSQGWRSGWRRLGREEHEAGGVPTLPGQEQWVTMRPRPMKQSSQAITSALELLRAEEQRLNAELALLRQGEKGLLVGLGRVQAGIQALEGDAARGSAQPTQKVGLADAEVMEVVIGSIQGSGARAEAELKAKLLQHAKAKGAVGTGLHLALKRVLKDPRFTTNGRGEVALVQAEGGS